MMKLRSYTTILALATSLLWIPKQVNASHIQGGELTYTCVGQDSFLVSFVLYRNCSGVMAPTTVELMVEAPGCAGQTIILQRVPGLVNRLDAICTSLQECSRCTFPLPASCLGIAYPGVESYVYEGLVVFPTLGCQQWTLSVSLCCKTVPFGMEPGSAGFFVSALLDRSVQPCISSPLFKHPLPPFICVNQPFIYNPGVVAPNGDSLSFSLVPCKVNAQKTLLDFPNGHLYALLPDSNVLFDSGTGSISMMPSLEGFQIACILVEEFRNGVKIGEIVRDFVFFTLSCPGLSSNAQLSGFNGGSTYDTAICPGQPISFDILSATSPPADSTFISWDESIPGATFAVSGGKQPVGTFSWQPGVADTGFFFFTVGIKDNNCPVISQAVYTYTIRIRSAHLDLPPSLPVCNGHPNSLKPSDVNMAVGFNQFQWSPAGGVADPTDPFSAFNPASPQTYTLSATNGFCGASATIDVVPRQMVSTVTISQDTLLANAPNARYQWIRCDRFGYGPIAGATNRHFVPAMSGKYAVSIETDSCTVMSGCYNFTLPAERNPTDPGQHSHNKLQAGEPDNGIGQFTLYPNPATGKVLVVFDSAVDGHYRLSVVTLSGQVLHRESLATSLGRNDFELDLSPFTPGLYQIALEGPDGMRVQKLVVME